MIVFQKIKISFLFFSEISLLSLEIKIYFLAKFFFYKIFSKNTNSKNVIRLNFVIRN